MTRNKTIRNENLIMIEALKAMQGLGGKLNRKEIKREIRDHSELISEEIVDELKTSKKTGVKYHPFNYRFNFAIKDLITAGYIVTDDNHILELSEKGRTVNFEKFNPANDVRPVVDEATNIGVLNDDEKLNVDDEPWKDELLSSLLKMSPKKFELFSRGLLTNMGIDLDDKIGIQYVGDGGLDGFGYITSGDFRTTRVALQAKRWDGKVSSPEIDKFRGAMDKHNAEYGVLHHDL